MTPEQFRQARQVFRDACDLPVDQRTRLLDSACADVVVRAMVERWLAEDARPQLLDDGPDVAPLLAKLASKSKGTTWTQSTDRGGPAASIGNARFLPGAMVGHRFRVIGLLGRGGMGEVYRAEDLTLGQAVALKFLPAGLDPNGPLVKRFMTEVRIARQVTHPNVCRVYDIATVDGQHFLSMEYVDGEDLASLLRRIGRLPSDKALQVAGQITAGLQAAHQQGILHRDLKPANVMIDGRGQVKITDFGLADLEAAIRPTDIRSGTPAYMAPEQLAGEEVTTRSDLFSLGLVLHELFTGKRAFEGDSVTELAPRHARGLEAAPSSHIEGLDRDVERIILRCLAHDPRDRPSSVAEVASILPSADAMQAALRAGETPSPNMVAAAGTKGLVPVPVLVGLLALVAAAIAASILLADRVWLLPQVSPPWSPTRLAENASEMIGRLRAQHLLRNETRRDLDVAYGLQPDRRLLARRERDPQFRARYALDADRPSALHFWYRESPTSLHAEQSGTSLVPVSFYDPVPYLPGAVNLLLDPRGRLLKLTAIPRRFDAAADTTPIVAAPNWAALFSEAGLEFHSFAKVAPTWAPGVASDHRAAWTGTLVDDLQVRVEAASLGTRVVAFAVLMPWDPPRDTAFGERERGTRFAAVAVTAVMTAFLVGGMLLAWRNIRRKRCDLAGARWIFAFSFLAGFLYWLLAVSRFPSGSSDILSQIQLAIAILLYWSTITSLGYLAIEPFVRRRAPEGMISWSRALAGRWRDPLVGRDLLLGLAAGAALGALPQTIDVLGRAVLGLPAPPPTVGRFPMIEPRMAFGALFYVATNSFVLAAQVMVVVLLVKVVVRKLWLAVVLCAVLFVAGTVTRGGNGFGWELASAALTVSGLLFVLFRYGLLAGVACCFASRLVQDRPGGSDITAWYAFPATSGFVVLAVLAVLAFLVALAGRPLIGDEALDR